MTGLKLLNPLESPLEAEAIAPDRFIGRSRKEIAEAPVHYGNEQARLGDFFDVNGDGTDEITLEGDLSKAKNIAAGMHLGSGMRGGEIHLYGNADDWAGAEMRGGVIHIRGNAGHDLGGGYRGSRHGMNRGMILVEGNAGNETGALMRRGLIVVTGDAGDFAGAFMIAGSLVVFGSLGMRPGAGLLRGSILTFQEPELLPTFRYDCSYRPGFVRLLLEDLQKRGLPVRGEYLQGSYKRYSGDFNRLGKGEILVYDQR